MSQCSNCGSSEPAFSVVVQCAIVREYGSPVRRDILTTRDWDIALCRKCTNKRYEESIRFYRRLGILLGPGLLVGSVLFTLALFRLLAEVRSPMAAMFALVLCGGMFLGGVVVTLLGLIAAAGGSAELRRLKREGEAHQFSNDEVWEAIEREGKRIIKCLESKKDEFHGEFSFPEALPPKRMGCNFYYMIRPIDISRINRFAH